MSQRTVEWFGWDVASNPWAESELSHERIYTLYLTTKKVLLMVRDRGIWHEVRSRRRKASTRQRRSLRIRIAIEIESAWPQSARRPPSRPAFLRFLDQYNDPLNYLLMAAAVIAVLVSVLQDGEHNEGIGDAIFIFIVLTANATFGYWQENRAEQAMDALKKMSSAMTKVLRTGGVVEIPADDLVPGDIVQLEIGAKVPADMRLVDLDDLSIDESTLTGESEPVEKITSPVDSDALLADRTNMAYKGTTVTNGRAQGVVVATGMRTQLGLIASDIASAETPKTPLERRLESLGVFLGWVAFVVAVVIVGIEVLFAFWKGRTTFSASSSHNSWWPSPSSWRSCQRDCRSSSSSPCPWG